MTAATPSLLSALVIAGLAALGGCATSQPAYLADSSRGWQVECGGKFGSWDSCSGEAQAVCGEQGYRVIGRNHQDGVSEAQANAAMAGQAYQDRTLLVQCAPSDHRLATTTALADDGV